MKNDFDVGGTWHWIRQGKLIKKINDFLNLSNVIIRYKNPKIKNGFEYHITQHRLQK